MVGGLLIALILFGSTTHSSAYTCPVGDARLGYDWVCDGGFTDAWTGAFTPFTQTYTSNVSGERVTKFTEPNRYGIIPLPVGFVVGSLLTLGVIAAVSMGPRRTAVLPAA